MNKIISVVGPTASGKTSFALGLAVNHLSDTAHDYDGVDLISVDSRQVYKGIETLTGADIPEGFEEINTEKFQYNFFQNKEKTISLHGVSCISLEDDWSVAHFKNFAIDIVEIAWKKNRLPILVGGTGLYHQYLFSKDENLYIPPNSDLRKRAKTMSLEELQKWLESVDFDVFSGMNNSDRNNPRIIVRAIEKKLGSPVFSEVKNLDGLYEITSYGMKLSLEELETKILQRVTQRFETGVFTEIKKINEVCGVKDSPVCSTLGVSDVNRYLNKEISKKECVKIWSLHEFQYAKRQLTWFAKQPDIIWLDCFEKKQYTEK